MPDIDDPILAKALELAPPLHDDPILAKALSMAPPKEAPIVGKPLTDQDRARMALRSNHNRMRQPETQEPDLGVVTPESTEKIRTEAVDAAKGKALYDQAFVDEFVKLNQKKIPIPPMALADTPYADEFRQHAQRRIAHENAVKSVQSIGYSPEKYAHQFIQKEAEYQQKRYTPILSDVLNGVYGAYHSVVGAWTRAIAEPLSRGIEKIGGPENLLAVTGQGAYETRYGAALNQPNPKQIPYLSAGLQGTTHALTLAALGMAAPEGAAATVANMATVGTFMATGASDRYTQAIDAGKPKAEAAAYAVRGGLIDGMTGMLFPAGAKTVSASMLGKFVQNLQHTAPLLVTQTGLTKVNDAVAGMGDATFTKDDVYNLLTSIALFSTAGAVLHSGGTEKEAINARTNEIKAENPEISRPQAYGQSKAEVADLVASKSNPSEIPNSSQVEPEVVTSKSAAGNPYGIDITASPTQEAKAAASENGSVSSDLGPSKQPSTDFETGEQLNERLRQRVKEAGKTAETSSRDQETPISPPPEDAVGIKHAEVDKQRAVRGQEGLPETIPVSDKATEAEANRRMENDAFAVDKLIVDLKATKRAASDVENVMLTRRYTELLNAHDEAVKQTADAINAKDSEKAASYGAEANKLNTVLTDFEDVTDMAGSQAGRDLRSRRFMMNRDYSLRQMTAERTVDKGRPLTPEEHAEVVKAHARIADLEKQVAESKTKERNKAADAGVAEVKTKAERPQPPKPKKFTERVTAALDKAAAEAHERLRKKGFGQEGTLRANVDPTMIADASIIAAAKIAKGVVNVADFMVKTYGEKIRPHLDEILKRANEHANEFARAVTRDDVLDRLKEKTAQGELGTITQDLRKIGEMVYHEGHQERDAMIDRVHEVTKDATGLTKDQTAMAFSGLGQFRPLNKAEAKVKVRQNYSEQQSLEKLKLIADGLVPPKTGMEREKWTPEKKALEKRVREEMRKNGLTAVDDATQLASQVQQRIDSLKRQAAAYQERINEKDYGPMRKNEPVQTDETHALEVQLKRVKDQYQSDRLKDKLAKRTPYEKLVDAVTGYTRGFGALSYPTVGGKLAAAAVARGGMTVAEDVAGAGLRRLAPNIAAKANVEGGPASREQYEQAWKGVKEGYTTQLKNLWRTGKMDIDVQYGKKDSGPKNRFFDFWGKTHAMMKSGVKQAIFERTTQRLIEDAVRRGVDPHSPQMEEAIGIRAYQEANRSIFLQDNYLSNKVKVLFAAQVAKGEAHPSWQAKTWELGGKVALPIVRVPTNIIAETFSHLAGAEFYGGKALIHHLRGDIEKLTPEQSNDIMRNLKKGVVGNAAVLLGYSLAGSIGGFYQHDKKLKGGIEPNTIEGKWWTKPLLHSPIGLAIQFGANLRHVQDKKGLTSAVGNSLVGTVENVPFVKETLDVARILESSDPIDEFGVQAGKHFVPGVVQKAAEWTDPAPDRKAKGPLQRFEKMLPYFREKLPAQSKK